MKSILILTIVALGSGLMFTSCSKRDRYNDRDYRGSYGASYGELNRFRSENPRVRVSADNAELERIGRNYLSSRGFRPVSTGENAVLKIRVDSPIFIATQGRWKTGATVRLERVGGRTFRTARGSSVPRSSYSKSGARESAVRETMSNLFR